MYVSEKLMTGISQEHFATRMMLRRRAVDHRRRSFSAAVLCKAM